MLVAASLEPGHRSEGAAARPGGPEGRQADFSDLQLAQLRSVVQQAVREEMRAGHLPSGCWTPPRAAESMCSADVRAGAKRKAPDEPVVVGLNDMDCDLLNDMDCDIVDTLSAKPEQGGLRLGRHSSVVTTLCQEKPDDIDTLFASHTGLVLRLRRLAYSIVRSKMFDLAIGLAIVGNLVCVGIEAQFRIDKVDASWVYWAESGFLVCFMFEALVRLLAHGRDNFSSYWFWFDIFLVTIGIFTWVTESMKHLVDVDDIPLANQILILRTLRVVRMVRAFRLMLQLKELWQLCSGLLRSARTMAAVSTLLLFFVFIFSCFGIDLITFSDKLRSNEETRIIVDKYFQSLPTFMLTLMQFVNADSIGSIYFPLCQEEPILVLYFASVWLVVTIVLMNLVTAIIVENAMAQGRDHEQDRQDQLRTAVQRMIPDIMAVFDRMDRDGSGNVTMEEVEAIARSGEAIWPSSIAEFVKTDKLLDLLKSFDLDGSGDVDREEFVDGVLWLVVSDVSVETHHILLLLKQCHALLEQMPTAPALRGSGPAADL